MKTKVSYRKATFADIPALVKMRMLFFEELKSNADNVDLEKMSKELNDYFEKEMRRENIVMWIATDEQKIVATSTMVLWQAPIGFSGIGKNGKGYILNMFTLPAYRKQGICGKLLKKLLETARSLNLEKVHLHATEDGMALYKRAGFKAPTYPELVLSLP